MNPLIEQVRAILQQDLSIMDELAKEVQIEKAIRKHTEQIVKRLKKASYTHEEINPALAGDGGRSIDLDVAVAIVEGEGR